MTNRQRTELINLLLEDQGMDDTMEFIELYVTDSIAPGICTSCQAVTDQAEPDARRNWCEACGRNTVVGGLVLMGVI